MAATQIHSMFDRLAPVYDAGNDLLSLGLARLWRRKAVAAWRAQPPASVLDVACGTGDFASAVSRAFPACHVMGLDFSAEMIARAKVKYPSLDFQIGDVLHLPFPDASFDAITCGWGLRNFTDRAAALAEIARVLKPNGRLLILEAVSPETPFFRFLFFLYRHLAAPLIGLVLFHPRAYSYLMHSMSSMPSSTLLRALLTSSGFSSITSHNLCCGMCIRYSASR